MKNKIFALSILFFSLSVCASDVSMGQQIIGAWQFTSYVYQDQSYPLPNPNLSLIFEFSTNGKEIIYWSRSDEPGFCEATASYEIKKGLLHSVILSVNPKNNQDCSSDPDMQTGKETFSPIAVENRQFRLNVGSDFIYIFNPTIWPKPIIM